MPLGYCNTSKVAPRCDQLEMIVEHVGPLIASSSLSESERQRLRQVHDTLVQSAHHIPLDADSFLPPYHPDALFDSISIGMRRDTGGRPAYDITFQVRPVVFLSVTLVLGSRVPTLHSMTLSDH